jgi:hypothetical protein
MSSAPANKASVDPETGRVLETDELRTASLAALRSSIRAAVSKGEFKLVRDDDAFLLAFLRAKKHDVPKALLTIKNFSKFWYESPAVVEGLCAAKCRRVYDVDVVRFLPGTDKQGNTLGLINMGKADYTKFTPADLARLSLYSFAWTLEHPEDQFMGVSYVESMDGFSVMSAMGTRNKLTEPEGSKMITLGLDTFPIRIRNIFLVKQPKWFNWFWGVVKYFFRSKLRDRLHVLGDDLEALHKLVPKENLPPELGGTLSTPQSAMLDAMEEIEKRTGFLGGFAIPMRELEHSLCGPDAPPFRLSHRRFSSGSLHAPRTRFLLPFTIPPSCAGIDDPVGKVRALEKATGADSSGGPVGAGGGASGSGAAQWAGSSS